MKILLENSKYLILLTVIASWIATIVAVVWGVYETALVVYNFVTQYKSASSTIVSFVQLMDIFLLVAVLYIFTVAVYELFIGDLELPKWLQIHNFDELKTVLSNLIVLIGAVAFLKYFLERNDPASTLLYALAVGIVSYVLIQFRKHGHDEIPSEPH
jgi:uncharacterized membrane protein YqhA